MIGVLVGMRSEARLLSGSQVVCSGGVPARGRELARRLLDEGAEGLVSFGIAGALAPAMQSGQLVVASAVAMGEHVYTADERWAHRLVAALPGAVSGIICGSDTVAATPADKHALHCSSGAVAVDMESAAVAEACRLAGKPFAVLRAIADPADRAVPELAMLGLGPDGSTRPLTVALGLLRRPQDLPALIRLGSDTRAALAALARAAGRLGPTLGFQLV